MPCPYFEPQRLAGGRKDNGGRLPLLEEYEGLCHAAGQATPAPEELCFTCCNEGYARGLCTRFPRGATRSAMRYNVTRRTDVEIDVLCIEEEDYAPIRWCEVKYLIDTAGRDHLEPDITDPCMRAQILAFCRSYLHRFPAQL